MPTLGEILLLLFVGAIAGWLAGLLIRGQGFGMIANIFIGIIGAVVGGFLLEWFGAEQWTGLLGFFIAAFLGAVVVLAITGLIGRATRR